MWAGAVPGTATDDMVACPCCISVLGVPFRLRLRLCVPEQSIGLPHEARVLHGTAQQQPPLAMWPFPFQCPPRPPSPLSFSLARSLPHPAAAGGAGGGVRGQPQGAAPATQQLLNPWGREGSGWGAASVELRQVATQQGIENWAGSRQPTWGLRRGGLTGRVVRCATWP